MEKSATPSLPTAGLWRRISAMIYESFLLLALLFIADYLFLALTHNSSSPLLKALLQAYLLLMMAGYFSWSWLRGQTLAMKTWRIRVVSRECTSLTLKQALLRFVLALILVPAFGISLIWALFDRDKQFLHDRLDDTRLVRTDV